MYGTRRKWTKHSTVHWDSTDWQLGLTVVQFCLNSFHLHSQNVSFKNQIGRKWSAHWSQTLGMILNLINSNNKVIKYDNSKFSTSYPWTMKSFLKSHSLAISRNTLHLLHFVAFFHVASLFSTRVDNGKVGGRQWKSSRAGPKLWNQVPSLDHFVFQNSGDFLCWIYKEVACIYV